jgi:group I intron endonuclease
MVSRRCYVGSSVQIEIRWSQHRRMLDRGTHHSPSLQRSWKKHGAEAFAFEVLEAIDGDLYEAEQRWIDGLDAAHPRKGFNVAPLAGTTRGYKEAPEVTAAKAERMRRHFAEHPEARERMREVGRKNGSAGKGRVHTGQALENMRAGSKAPSRIKASLANIAKASAANVGRPSYERSADLRQRLSEMRTDDPKNGERLAKARASVTPEGRASGGKKRGDKLRGRAMPDRRSLTYDQAEQIRAEKAAGATFKALSAKWGLDVAPLHRIVHRKTYATP